MGTKNFDNYSDLITFTRASSGTALRPISYGDELVTNGTFDSADGWTLETGFSISGGQLIASNVAGLDVARINIEAETDKIYAITVNVSAVTAGSFRVLLYSDTKASATQQVNASGNYQLNVIVNSTGTAYLGQLAIQAGTTSSFVIDNISIREVLFDQPNAPLTLFNHPTNIPRIEYDADGNRLGLLVEESRTNLSTYSEDVSQWGVANNPVITSNIATAPDGSETVDGIQDTTGSTFKRAKAFNSSVTANSTATGSLFVKKETSETKYGGLTLNFTGGTTKACY